MASSPPAAPACPPDRTAASIPRASGTTRTRANLTNLIPCMFPNPFVRRSLPALRTRLQLHHCGWFASEPIVDPIPQVLKLHAASIHSSSENEPACNSKRSFGPAPHLPRLRIRCRFDQATHTLQAIVDVRRNIFAKRILRPAKHALKGTGRVPLVRHAGAGFRVATIIRTLITGAGAVNRRPGTRVNFL